MSFDLQPPQEMNALAKWFSEGVHAELHELEKKGGTQVYELHSGRLIELKGPNQGTYTFLIADGTRIPEDTNGRLKNEDSEFTASVIGQQGNIIHEYDFHYSSSPCPGNNCYRRSHFYLKEKRRRRKRCGRFGGG